MSSPLTVPQGVTCKAKRHIFGRHFSSSNTEQIIIFHALLQTVLVSMHSNPNCMVLCPIASKKILTPTIRDTEEEVVTLARAHCSYAVLLNCRRNLSCFYKVKEVSPLWLKTQSDQSLQKTVKLYLWTKSKLLLKKEKSKFERLLTIVPMISLLFILPLLH